MKREQHPVNEPPPAAFGGTLPRKRGRDVTNYFFLSKNALNAACASSDCSRTLK